MSHMLEEDALTILVMKTLAEQTLIAKIRMEMQFVLAGILFDYCKHNTSIKWQCKSMNTNRKKYDNHRPNYEGDAYVSCELNPCLTDLCGINADCQKSGRQALCTCRQGYTGDAFQRSDTSVIIHPTN